MVVKNKKSMLDTSVRIASYIGEQADAEFGQEDSLDVRWHVLDTNAYVHTPSDQQKTPRQNKPANTNDLRALRLLLQQSRAPRERSPHMLHTVH